MCVLCIVEELLSMVDGGYASNCGRWKGKGTGGRCIVESIVIVAEEFCLPTSLPVVVVNRIFSGLPKRKVRYVKGK